jgi:hypothetical protein
LEAQLYTAFPLTTLFLVSYIPSMAWDVEYTNEFESWWNSLGEDEQEEIDRKVRLLEARGPTLPRPHADVAPQHEGAARED